MAKIISGLALLAILAAAGSSCSSKKAADNPSKEATELIVDSTVVEISGDSIAAEVAVDSTIAQ